MFFDQVISELTKSQCILVIAEVQPHDGANPDITKARTVVVAVLYAQTNRPANDQGKKIYINMQCSWQYLGQNIQSPIDAGSLIRGRFMRSSTARLPTCDQIRSYSLVPVHRLDGAANRWRDGVGSRGPPRRHSDLTESRVISIPRHVTIASSTVLAARARSASTRSAAAAGSPVRDPHSTDSIRAGRRDRGGASTLHSSSALASDEIFQS